MPFDKNEILNLPEEEKYELVMELWDNIQDQFLRKIKTGEEFETEIERRIELIDKNPEILIPWEDVVKKMKKE